MQENKPALPAESQASNNPSRLRKACYIAWTGVGYCILAGVLIYLLNIMALPVSMFIWTFVFIFSLRGIVAGLEKRGVKRLLGTTIAYVIMFAGFGIVMFLMFSPIFGLNEQFINIVKSVPGYIDSIVNWMKSLTDQYSTYLDNQTVKSMITTAYNSLSSWGSDVASGAASAAVNVGAGIANAVYAIGFALVIAFWILLELPAIGRETKRVMPERFYTDAEFLHYTFTRILGGYIKAMIIQCFIIGVCCGILFAVCGVANAPALGVITGILNIIPIIGPWLGGAVAAISAVFVSPLTALIVLVGTIIIQQFVYTFISPKLMQSSVDIHPALTLIAMVFGSAIGAAMNGFMGSLVGMLLAIPFVAVARSCFIFYFERSTGRQIVASDGFIFKGKPSDNQSVDPLMDATNCNLSQEEASKAE